MLIADKTHYPSLELCKELKKVNIPRTEKYWFKFNWLPHFIEMYEHTASWGSFTRYDYFCPSVMEMLEYIRTIEGENNHEYNIRITYVMQWKYHVEYERWFWPKFWFQDTLPNALAKMILWLVEHNYLSFE